MYSVDIRDKENPGGVSALPGHDREWTSIMTENTTDMAITEYADIDGQISWSQYDTELERTVRYRTNGDRQGIWSEDAFGQWEQKRGHLQFEAPATVGQLAYMLRVKVSLGNAVTVTA